jgi:hypothetical protein
MVPQAPKNKSEIRLLFASSTPRLSSDYGTVFVIIMIDRPFLFPTERRGKNENDIELPGLQPTGSHVEQRYHG